MNEDFIRRNLRNSNFYLLLLVVFVSLVITLPVIKYIPSHPDEHQFYLNAFQIMAGAPLHNYLHVALTEYLLAGFLLFINLFTVQGTNFPQGDPTTATFFWGHLFGAILYYITLLLGLVLVQKGEEKIGLRSVIFSILYLGSLGVFERFLRVNSDSIMIFVFLNYLIISIWQHKVKASNLKIYAVGLLFIFLGSFTNLKSLYLVFPLFLINTYALVFRRQNSDPSRLPFLYRALYYFLGAVVVPMILWIKFIPRPFDPIKFWYTVKKTIVHGTAFDFDYPSQAHNSWLVYIYDFFVEYINLPQLVLIILLVILAFRIGNVSSIAFRYRVKAQIKALARGNLVNAQELILFICIVAYYIGISSRVIHWSRWGAPLGVLFFIFISPYLEVVVKVILSAKPKVRTIIIFFLVAWGLRFALTYDLYRAQHPKNNGFTQSIVAVDEYFMERGMTEEDMKKKVMWFTGYTPNVGNYSLEYIAKEGKEDLDYVLWPYWNMGVVYTDRSVDKEVHNLRAIIDKYTTETDYLFPSLLSRYSHYTKKFAWNTLGITWNPEIDSLVENQIAVTKLVDDHDTIEVGYTLDFDELAHYKSPYSRLFTMATLKDGYMFPPCYSYPDAKRVSNGEFVSPPSDVGIGARTEGLYCHSVRIRVMMEGLYRIHIEGLPEDSRKKQRIYYNLGKYEWDEETDTATIFVKDTRITAEFGVATLEKKLPDLKFRVMYVHD